ncbi:MAG: hypothetical protein HKN10_18000 [Myxococcales bacterium]|nr:hypothetical protein [Myxococcales bacterium]
MGRLQAAMPKNTNVLVLTDHGMAAVNRGADYSGGDRPHGLNSGHHLRGRPGVAIVSGPGFRQGDHFGRSWRKQDLPTLASVYDVTPSLLTLLGIPVGDDMVGTVMPAVSAEGTGTVTTHDSDEWLAARSHQRGERVEDDPERMRQLRALGYID